jgi:hypothetical protein
MLWIWIFGNLFTTCLVQTVEEEEYAESQSMSKHKFVPMVSSL